MLKILKVVNKVRLNFSFQQYHQINVLGIETTCDDTCAAIINNSGQILSDCKSSQYQFHLDMGGILPLIARDKHAKNISNVVKQALKASNLSWNDISAISVANEPGLELSLKVGIDYAQKLALKYNKPLIKVHHMEAHSLIAKLTHPQLQFPFLALLISGGHCLLALIKDVNLFYKLGETIDNPIGETLDKIARQLKVKNLGPPFDQMCGGQALELLAENGNSYSYSNNFKGPPLMKKSTCDFSFSSYKSYVKNLIEKLTDHSIPSDCPLPQIMDIAASIQYMIGIQLSTRINRAVKFLELTNILNLKNSQDIESIKKDFTQTNSEPLKIPLVVSGGVACNQFLSNLIEKYCKKMEKAFQTTQVDLIVPNPRYLCTDNGVMIAWNGMLKLINQNLFKQAILKNKKEILSLKADPDANFGIDIRNQVEKAKIKIKFVNI